MKLNIEQFQGQYANESDCIPLLFRMRWPTGYHCPRCASTAFYMINTRRLPLYECRKCIHQTSLTAGSIMDKSRTPLNKWLLVMYIVAACNTNINAVHLAKLIAVTYKTAWSMLNKIRRTITDLDRTILLSGHIEAKPDIYTRRIFHSTATLQREQSVIVARTKSSTGPSYYKIKLAPAQLDPRKPLSQAAEDEFRDVHIDPAATHIDIIRKPIIPWDSHPQLRQFAPSAFQWMNDTFHGISASMAQSYMDEYCYRVNTKHLTPSQSFELLLGHSLAPYSSKDFAQASSLLKLAM